VTRPPDDAWRATALALGEDVEPGDTSVAAVDEQRATAETIRGLLAAEPVPPGGELHEPPWEVPAVAEPLRSLGPAYAIAALVLAVVGVAAWVLSQPHRTASGMSDVPIPSAPGLAGADTGSGGDGAMVDDKILVTTPSSPDGGPSPAPLSRADVKALDPQPVRSPPVGPGVTSVRRTVKELPQVPDKDAGASDATRGTTILRVNARPWAKCTVGDYGPKTTRFEVELPAMRFVRVDCSKGGMRKRKSVKLIPGETVSVTFDFR